MASNFHETLERDPVKLPSDRSVGWAFAAVSALAAFHYRHDETLFILYLALTAGFTVASFALPIVLRPLNIVWYRLGLVLHKIVNPIIMGILFYGLVTPFGMLMRISHDPLRARRSSKDSTYWVPVASNGSETASMRNQF